MSIQITFPEAVIGRHLPTLVGLGFQPTSPTTVRAAGFHDKWLRGEDGKVVKVNGRGLYAPLDCSTGRKMAQAFRAAAASQTPFMYDQRFLLPNGVVMFGGPAAKTPWLQSESLKTFLGFDPTALICKKAKS